MHAASLSDECTLPEFDETHSQMVSEFVMQMQERLETSKDHSWRDIPQPLARLAISCPKDPARLLVDIRVQIQDQAPGLLLFAESGGVLQGGLVPIFCAVSLWPSWLPFCESTKLLARIGPGQEIWMVRFKVAVITADCILYLGIVDRLQAAGCIDIIMGSPEEGMESSAWLGIAVPQKSAQIRVPINAFRLSLRPTSMSDGIVHIQTDMVDTLKIEWIHVLFWRTLSTSVLPTIFRVHSKFDGSALDKHYNGCSRSSMEARSFFVNLGKQVQLFLEAQ